jgi:trypsin
LRHLRLVLSFIVVALLLVSPVLADKARIPLRIPGNTVWGSDFRSLPAGATRAAVSMAALKFEAGKSGSVRVAIKTEVAFAPESLLGDWERTVQRREIAGVAASLRRALPKAKEFKALLDLPYVLITLDEKELAQLEALPGIVRIVPEDGFNWMRDYVEARTAARNAVGPLSRATTAVRRMEPKIVGGIDSTADSHPFQAGLLHKRLSSNAAAWYCGGTLVSPYHVVTAAHCSDFVDSRSVQVLVGTKSLARGGGGTRINVSRILVNEGWDPATNNNDVAVWELAKPVMGIPFATIASIEPTTPGVPLRSTGWGVLQEGSSSAPTTLKQVDLPFVPTVDGACDLVEDVTPQMLCAGEAGKDTCQGDSGGPLTIDRGSGYTELVGIVSWGYGCGEPGYPGVYTNVAESGINGFIRSHVDAPRTFEFQVGNYEVSEAGRRVTLTVTRSLTAGTATVMLATAPGTAAAKSDFRTLNRKLTFRSGVASVSVPITIINDRLVEGPESFSVTLSNPSAGMDLGARSATTVAIVDNEFALTSQPTGPTPGLKSTLTKVDSD